MRVRVPETAPEVERKRERERERETPPSTSSESSTFGQVSQTLSGVQGHLTQRICRPGHRYLYAVVFSVYDITLISQSSRRLTGNWREVEGFGNDFKVV